MGRRCHLRDHGWNTKSVGMSPSPRSHRYAATPITTPTNYCHAHQPHPSSDEIPSPLRCPEFVEDVRHSCLALSDEGQDRLLRGHGTIQLTGYFHFHFYNNSSKYSLATNFDFRENYFLIWGMQYYRTENDCSPFLCVVYSLVRRVVFNKLFTSLLFFSPLLGRAYDFLKTSALFSTCQRSHLPRALCTEDWEDWENP